MQGFFSSLAAVMVTGTKHARYALVGLTLVLAACDPGRNINKLNHEMYQRLVESKTLDTEEGAGEFMIVAGFARQTADNYPNFKSGKESKKLLSRMESDYLKMLNTLRPVLAAEGKQADESEAQLKSLSNKVAKELKAKPDIHYSAPYPFKSGDCVVSSFEKEFSKNPSYMDIKISRVEKVGKDKVLLMPIFDMITDYGLPKQTAKNAEPDENYKNLTENYLKISCTRANEIIKKGDEYVELFRKVKSRVSSLAGVAEQLQRNFPEDLMKEDVQSSN